MKIEKLAPVRVNPVLRHPSEQFVSLEGNWHFRLDPRDEGLRRGWFRPAAARLFEDRVRVPGNWQGQGFGDESCDKIWDFQIEARTLRATYKGTGWYVKRFPIREDWQGRRVWLNFGGVHPSADVWLNGCFLGSHSAPFVPFGFDITPFARSDRDNLLVIRVHEKDRLLGLSYSWQGNWSGLYRSAELRATGEAWLGYVAILPAVDGERLRVRVRTGGVGEDRAVTISVAAPNGSPVTETVCRLGDEASCEVEVPVKAPALWSPDGPSLYRVDVVLRSGREVADAVAERVGFLKLSTRGKHFLVNDEPYYLRGSGDFVINPETASPDTDRTRWRRKLATLRAYGYNYVRCQSNVPAPEYFDVADEVGLLVQTEMGMLGGWGGMSPWHTYYWPQPTPVFRKALRWQWDRTVMRDVNHPSASIYCMSNELYGHTEFPRTAWDCYRRTKAIKPHAFVIWTDGGQSKTLPGDFLNAEASFDKDYELPVIQHEFRWWSSYPDVRLKGKYTGAVRPYAIEIAQAAAARNGMAHLLPLIAENSNRLQYLEARTKMENCRRDNPTLAGICHFNAMDSGLSPQGVVNEFYEHKLVDAATWLRTNGDTVVLMNRNFDDRVLAGGESLEVLLSVSDFSHPPLERPTLEWRLTAGSRTLGKGTIRYEHEPFRTCPAGKIRCKLPSVKRPVSLSLVTVLKESGRSFGNQWSFWLFPERTALPKRLAVYGEAKYTWIKDLKEAEAQERGGTEELGKPSKGEVVLTERLDERLAEFVKRGGRVLLAASEGLVRPFAPKLGLSVGRYFFTPPANYGPLEDGHDGSIVRDHPMLGDFPHEGWADLDFYRLIAESPPIDLRPFGKLAAEPVIRPIGTYFTCYPFAYLIELRLGKGGLILSALNLDQKLPEARYLLAAIVRYAASRSFRPKATLSDEGLAHLIEETSLP